MKMIRDKISGASASKRSSVNYIFIAVTLILTAVLVIGTAYARYSNSDEFTLNFRYSGQADQIFLLKNARDANNKLTADANGNYSSPGGWTSSGAGRYSLSFLLANGNAVNRFCLNAQDVTLTVFVSDGVGSIENIAASLSSDGTLYNAVFTRIDQSSSLYGSYGAGWIGNFKDGENAEPVFSLPGGVFSYKEMTLTVSGTNDYPASVTIIASAS